MDRAVDPSRDPEMTQLILIRHGETVWNQEGRMQGQSDSPLSEIGVHQARRLAGRLARMTFSALYSSDLGRAHYTARSIADATGHAIVLDERLRERNFGVFEGLTAAEINASYPDEYARFRRRDPAYVMSGGESAAAFRERCLGCLLEFAERHAGSSIVVVTHGLVLDAAYRAAHALGFDQPRPVPLLNASLNFFRCNGERWHCELWGDVGHLDEAVITRFESGTWGRS
jgi:probable phosphoglycerate mutase